MSHKVLFSHSYFLRFDPKQWKLGQPYAPLATITAAAFLREKGYEVDLFDTMFAEAAEDIFPLLQKTKPAFFVLYDDGFNYLTKMCLTNMREAAFKMAKEAKKHGCKVIFSSSDSTDRVETYLDNGADFIIKGEGEQTLLELLDALSKNNSDLKSIQGIAFRENGNTITTSKREVMRDLDALPMPAWDLVNMLEYKMHWLQKNGYFSINMSTTRGCPYKCNWCAKPIYGNRYNSRSVNHVIKELKYLKQIFDFDHIWFCDDIFGLKPGWTNEFAAAVKRENLSFQFKIQSRVDLLLEENNIEALARAGCETAWVGAESGSQKILDAMDKGTKVAQIYEATRLLKKFAIKPAFFLQFGYLGETQEDIDMTIHMLNELLPDDIGISVSYPLPGTLFYDKVKNDLKDKTNWTDSDEMAMLFRSTYPSSFYKALQRYVHRNYRTKQGIAELKTVFTQPSLISISRLKRIAAVPFHLAGRQMQKRKLNQYSVSASDNSTKK
ncbi:MAG: B12-binding domain-containing radical SAM protein [Bacteroidetes bacterium]|nr:B12-binding domain-containing radical SAM protein [Bacteroidota bacterium]